MVSSFGDVRNIETDRILKAATDKYGYKYYVLCVNGVRKTVKAHRLVAMAFIPNSENKEAVDHINGNRQDNRACNLRWVTNKENTHNPQTMPGFLETVKAQIPKMYKASLQMGFGKKPVIVVFESGEKKLYPSLKAAAESVGKNKSKLSEVLNGKRKQYPNFTATWYS